MDQTTFVTGYKLPFDGYSPGMAEFYGGRLGALNAVNALDAYGCAPCRLNCYLDNTPMTDKERWRFTVAGALGSGLFTVPMAYLALTQRPTWVRVITGLLAISSIGAYGSALVRVWTSAEKK